MLCLKDKILEETEEFLADPCVKEAADILEVVKTLAQLQGISFDNVIRAAQDKAALRGGFCGGIVLESVGES